MCTFDKVLNQRVDWVAWASIQTYGARDAIDDACTTSSDQQLEQLANGVVQCFLSRGSTIYHTDVLGN